MQKGVVGLSRQERGQGASAGVPCPTSPESAPELTSAAGASAVRSEAVSHRASARDVDVCASTSADESSASGSVPLLLFEHELVIGAVTSKSAVSTNARRLFMFRNIPALRRTCGISVKTGCCCSRCQDCYRNQSRRQIGRRNVHRRIDRRRYPGRSGSWARSC